MQAERWQRLQELFEAASALASAERPSFLAEACGTDADLRREVEQLLAAEAGSHARLESTIRSVAGQVQVPPAAGDRVGAYRLLRELGRGGMGTVYLAVRADDAFDKQVAIKVLRSGRGSLDLERRFLAERQILAGFEHPNIARMLDGGTTEAGHPYVVMEYVEGEPIDDYCERRACSPRQRLELFRKVCAAVQTAHQNLVVHRDLKPSNILVTAEGEPKLLDFGIAKLLRSEPIARTDETRDSARLLTPEYASPEQVRGGPITTASDVYSLGVLLYKLLTARLPYRLRTGEPAELLRAILEEPPQAPSSAERVATREVDAGDKDVDLVAVGEERRNALRGDLDAILLQALRKEPERRYASVEQLSEDVRRHLEGLPVLARPDTLSYRASKFLRRHRLAAAATLGLFLALVGAVLAVSWQARVAAGERDRALEAEALADRRSQTMAAVNRFMQAILTAPDPRQSGLEIRVHDALRIAVERLEAHDLGDPLVEAGARLAIGTVYRSLSALTEAEPLLEGAVDLYQRELGPTHAETLSALHELAVLRREQGGFAESEELLERLLEGRQAVFGERSTEVAAVLEVWGQLDQDLLRSKDAERRFAQALAIRQEVQGLEHPDTLIAMKHLAGTLWAAQRWEEAASVQRQVLALQEKALGPMHMDTLATLSDLAVSLSRTGEQDEAIELSRRALEGFTSLLPAGHWDLSVTRYNLARQLERAGRTDEALAVYQEALPEAEATLPAEHYILGVLRAGAGRCHLALGNLAEAKRLLVSAAAVLEAAFGVEHESATMTRDLLAQVNEREEKRE
jgi:serine/threonine-protein kinase